MASSSHALGLHNYSFDSTSSTSPAGYPYPHHTQGVTSADLALLAQQFGQQTIEATNNWVSQQQSRTTTETAASSDQDFSESECAMTARRAQRQANTILQSQDLHAHQLSSLLERMMASREHCSACVAEQAIVAETPVWDEDETMGEMEEEDGDWDRPMLTYRRSADLSTEKGYVNKTIRVRKRGRGYSAYDSQFGNLNTILRTTPWNFILHFSLVPGDSILCQFCRAQILPKPDPKSLGQKLIADPTKTTASAPNLTTPQILRQNQKTIAMASAVRMSTPGAANAVRLILMPSPANLLESREVLRICQSFGEVTTFKHLKYHDLNPAPNAALAVFQRPESAEALIRASPVTFTLETQSGNFDNEDTLEEGRDEFSGDIAQNTPSRTDATELHTPNSLLDSGFSTPLEPQTSSKPSSEPHQQRNKRSSSTLKDMRCFVEYWRGNQQDFLERSPTWGPFTVHKDNAVQQDLERRVPLVGLSDINVQKREVPLRILRKRQEEMRERKSWMQIWEEGRRESGEGLRREAKELGGGRRP
ncbi:hypothetical protein EG328_002363 [Venturia inaequalis]|uniref:Uncharacterized protein n=1 Tax=Venturia inaequalis TaxID=5025 RepID=A0A8H3UWF9_VENIN|nr:hypothetical protein EG328_002363 [Venturia inaequalis]